MVSTVSLNSHSVRNLPKQSLGFGNTSENSSIQKIADLSEATEEKILKPGAALAAIAVGAGVGARGGGKLITSLTPGIKAASEAFSSVLVPIIKKQAEKANFIGRVLQKSPELVNLAKGENAVTAVAEKLAAPVHTAIKTFTALAAAVFVGQKTPQMENALSSLVDTTAITTAISN